MNDLKEPIAAILIIGGAIVFGWLHEQGIKQKGEAKQEIAKCQYFGGDCEALVRAFDDKYGTKD